MADLQRECNPQRAVNSTPSPWPTGIRRAVAVVAVLGSAMLLASCGNPAPQQPAAQPPAAERVVRSAEEQAWDSARVIGSIEAFNQYVRDFADGPHVSEARQRIAGLEQERAETERRAAARKRRAADDLAFAEATRAATVEAYTRYLREFADGAHVAEARQRVQPLEQQHAEAERQRAEQARREAEQRAEAERQRAEQARREAEQRAQAEQQQRVEQERREAEQKAQAERQRIEQERREAEQRAQAEQQRAAQQRREAEQRAEAERQRAEQERAEAQRRAEQERAEAERLRAEQDRQRAEAERQRVDTERIAAQQRAEAEHRAADDAAFADAGRAADAAGWTLYLQRFPAGAHAADAQQKLAAIERQAALATAKADQTATAPPPAARAAPKSRRQYSCEAVAATEPPIGYMSERGRLCVTDRSCPRGFVKLLIGGARLSVATDQPQPGGQPRRHRCVRPS